MTLKLSKVRGQANTYVFTYDNGSKVVSWQVDGNDVSTETLTDVVDTVFPAIPPTKPQFPITMPPEMYIPQIHGGFGPPFVEPENAGAAAADKAALEEEMRLRNMGGALRTGINLAADDIPVVDSDRNDLGSVDWRQ